MKLGTPFYILLTLAFVFVAVGLIVANFNTNYPESGFNESSALGTYSKFNYVENLNNAMGNITKDAENIGTQETGVGWWTLSLLNSGWVIVKMLITSVVMIVISIPLFGIMLVEVGNALGIPSSIIAIASIAITAGIVMMLVKFVHKGQS